MLQVNEIKKVSSSSEAADILRAVLNHRNEEDKHKEFFYVIGLSTRNAVLFVDLVAIGTVNWCGASRRECFRQAIIKNAHSIIVGHNHPSGDTSPSPEDRIFTRKLKEGGEVLEVRVLDHIIIGSDYYSFADQGQL